MAYQQPVTALLDFIRAQYPKGPFKEFYDGDPDLIPDFNMPAIVVEKDRDDTTVGPTGFQRVTDVLRVKVVFNKKDDWKDDADPTQLTEKRIRDIVEARDPATGGYLPTTLKYALMHRFSMDGKALNQDMAFELGALPRPEDGFTQEGHLTFSISYLVPNPPQIT